MGRMLAGNPRSRWKGEGLAETVGRGKDGDQDIFEETHKYEDNEEHHREGEPKIALPVTH